MRLIAVVAILAFSVLGRTQNLDPDVCIANRTAEELQYQNNFVNQYCIKDHNDCTVQIERPGSKLNQTEQLILEKYTESNLILDQKIFDLTLTKFCDKSGVFYHGGSQRSSKVGQVITLKSFLASSGSPSKATDFINAKSPQMMVIYGKSAKRIVSYSLANEDEHVFTAGTKLKVKSIKFKKINLSSGDEGPQMVNVQIVTLTEI